MTEERLPVYQHKETKHYYYRTDKGTTTGSTDDYYDREPWVTYKEVKRNGREHVSPLRRFEQKFDFIPDLEASLKETFAPGSFFIYEDEIYVVDRVETHVFQQGERKFKGYRIFADKGNVSASWQHCYPEVTRVL